MPRLAGGGPSPRGASLKDSMRCPLRFALTHITPYLWPTRRETPLPLARGDLVHHALACHNTRLMCEQNGWNPDEFYTPQQALAIVAREHKGDASYQLSLDVCSKAVRAYELTYTPQNTQWEIIAVEHMMELWFHPETGELVPQPKNHKALRRLAKERPVKPWPRGEPILHSARVDFTVRQYNLYSRIDLKTTYATSKVKLKDKSEGFRGDLQLTAHHIGGVQAYGDKYEGTYCQLIEMNPPYRHPLLEVGASNSLLRAGTAMLHFERTLRYLHETYPDPRQWPAVLSEQGPCKDRYGVCPFWQVCRG